MTEFGICGAWRRCPDETRKGCPHGRSHLLGRACINRRCLEYPEIVNCADGYFKQGSSRRVDKRQAPMAPVPGRVPEFEC